MLETKQAMLRKKVALLTRMCGMPEVGIPLEPVVENEMDADTESCARCLETGSLLSSRGLCRSCSSIGDPMY
jgi:hypothetical protein